MKNKILMAMALWMSAVAVAAGPYNRVQYMDLGMDYELFLKPYVDEELGEISGEVLLNTGCGFAYCPGDKKSYISFDETELNTHFNELSYAMKEGTRLLIAAPASYGILFTDGTQLESDVEKHIQQVLSKIGKSHDKEMITSHLATLTEVMRATFVHTAEGLKLVTDEKALSSGQQIWCKLPGTVVSGVYHSEEEYLVAFRVAGLTCEEIKRPCFFGSVKYNLWRASQGLGAKTLGDAYLTHNPFTLYYVVKQG